MGYNHGLEEKKFEARWKKLRVEYAAAGMSKDAIDAMEEFDREQMNQDRRYYENTQGYDFRKADGTAEENKSKSYLQKFGERLHVEAKITNPDRRDAWIDELDDENLVSAVKALSPDEINLLTMLVYEGYTHKQISRVYGKGRSSITEKIGRIAKKIKKF